jgi:hypothetical protein
MVDQDERPFRLFGYRGSMKFTVYPDTWIRDLPLLMFGEGAYVSNRATLRTNIVLSNGYARRDGGLHHPVTLAQKTPALTDDIRGHDRRNGRRNHWREGPRTDPARIRRCISPLGIGGPGRGGLRLASSARRSGAVIASPIRAANRGEGQHGRRIKRSTGISQANQYELVFPAAFVLAGFRLRFRCDECKRLGSSVVERLSDLRRVRAILTR